MLQASTFYKERPPSSDESRPSSRSFCELKYRTQMRVNTARKTMASMPESMPRIFPVPSPVGTAALNVSHITEQRQRACSSCRGLCCSMY